MNPKLQCILLVDDDKATNFLNNRLLTKMEVAQNIFIAKNGVEAENYLQKALHNQPGFPRPELILLDINMPFINGWEFLDRYENLPASFKQNIRILMLTTSLREADIERARITPSVKGLIFKPLNEDEIRWVIQQNFYL